MGAQEFGKPSRVAFADQLFKKERGAVALVTRAGEVDDRLFVGIALMLAAETKGRKTSRNLLNNLQIIAERRLQEERKPKLFGQRFGGVSLGGMRDLVAHDAGEGVLRIQKFDQPGVKVEVTAGGGKGVQDCVVLNEMDLPFKM